MAEQAPRRDGPRWLHHLRHPTSIFLLTRGLLLISAYLGLRLKPQLAPSPTLLPLHGGDDRYRAFPGAPALDGWVRWDSAWYFNIIERGYSFTPGKQSNVAFFPLYPILSGLLSLPLRVLLPEHQAFYTAGLLIAHSTFFLALRGASRFAGELLEPRDAQRAMWLLCLFPYALFFCAAYTEALYLALTVWALLEARHGRFTRASLYAALASATRSTGILLTPLLALERLRQRGWHLRELSRADWSLIIAPCGLLAFVIYQWIQLDEPFAFVRVQAAWNRSFGLPNVALIWRFVSSPMVSPFSRLDLLLQLVLIFTLPLLAIVAWRRCGLLLGVWCLLSLAPAMTAGSAAALGRFAAVIFPLFFGLAPLLRRRTAMGIAVAVMVGLQLALTYGFSHWQSPV